MLEAHIEARRRLGRQSVRVPARVAVGLVAAPGALASFELACSLLGRPDSAVPSWTLGQLDAPDKDGAEPAGRRAC